jgi:hypothetical protein
LFSVALPGQLSVKARVTVRHEGEDSGDGIWTCSKDGRDGCAHVTQARRYLRHLVGGDLMPGETDAQAPEITVTSTGKR